MAYNREWDRGKDSWNDYNGWSGSSSKQNMHGRDEEYYGDGKRRKYNDGSHVYSQGQEDGGRDYTAGYGQGRQTDYNDASQDDKQQRGFHAKKRLVPSEPSPHVIFLGLDPDFTEADLQAYLTSNGCSIETVTIIRERSTGASKGFGFAQFPTTEHARAFVDPMFPFIQIPPPASHGASARTAFNKALETGAAHNGRRVKIDYSQSVTPHDRGRSSRQSLNDGTRDIGNTQAPVLLFRGLDPLSGPQAIHQAMRLSSGPGVEGAKGMKRIILIKDKVTLASFGFAFVEFVDAQSAAAVLAATMSPQIHPSGFRISDRPVAASFAHPYSFQPVTDYMLRDEAALPSSVALGGAEDSWVRYWDESSTAAVLEFEVEAPQAAAPAKATKEKKKVKSDTVVPANEVAAPAEASVLPISDKPVTLSFSKNISTAKAAPLIAAKATPAVSLAFSNDDAAGSSDDNAASAESATKLSTGKKVAPLIASQKTVQNINKWNQVQEELKGNAGAPSTTAPAPAAPVKISAPSPAKASPEPEAEFEFSDTNAKTCLLCARQFKSLDQLKRHNQESDLHKRNYKDSNLREVAKQKAAAVRQGAKSTFSEQPKYRDRASERRIMHNQPEAPMIVPDKETVVNKKRAEGPPRPASPVPQPPPLNPGQDENNVGNKLLKMMGWTEGTGLGTSGEGRVDPIQTAIYAQGVGLGASKAKEVGKFTDYAEGAREMARERYGGS